MNGSPRIVVGQYTVSYDQESASGGEDDSRMETDRRQDKSPVDGAGGLS